MIGCVVGAACLVGLVGVLRRHRRRCHGGYGGTWHGHGRGCHGYGNCHGGGRRRHGFGSYGAWGHAEHDDGHGYEHDGGGFFRGLALRHVFERLRTTPAQEREIAAALADLEKAARGRKKDWRDTREQVAQAIRTDDFNAEILGAVFSQHDDVIESLRKELVGTLARVHEALDERQRDELARLLERGGFAPRWA